MVPPASAEERRSLYARCRKELAALLEGEPDPIARMASAAALVAEVVPQASFVGFYRVVEEETLVVGPYQGPPACLRIRFGRGVCGTAARENRALVVADVGAFPGHIACDPTARSEIVIPVHAGNGTLVGVLDLDSRQAAAFDELDRAELEGIMRLLFSEGA